MIHLSKKQTSKLLSAAVASNGRLSAKEYRKIIAESDIKTVKELDLNFIFKVDVIKKNKEYLFTLIGRHLSTNVINNLPFKQKLRYKTAIKNAAKIFFLTNKTTAPKSPFSKVVIYPTSITSHSRDDDGASVTLKILRDLFVTYGFVIDDNRKHMTQEKCSEILQKKQNWKLELRLIVES